MVANLKTMDLYERRLANPVHYLCLETGEVWCKDPKPGEKLSTKMKNVSCLECRERIMADSHNLRSVWGQ
jgi:hypothetical protein